MPDRVFSFQAFTCADMLQVKRNKLAVFFKFDPIAGLMTSPEYVSCSQ